ncbi:hypothetical protein J0S82_000880 [Galemys pyrenaicus]|uniref:Uncharacterized protein n=1 Tax=Galemys pyrenaicus TaxID=202257 RepID=A0A8J6A6J8_GALPY|nr:hypothetical protein J0S82_000880 [Galemys pyrenaicus]
MPTLECAQHHRQTSSATYPQNKQSKAESEQALPSEPKQRSPAAATPAVGLDLGLGTTTEVPVEEAVVSATFPPPSTSSPAAAMLTLS